jgi:hypothetical protein
MMTKSATATLARLCFSLPVRKANHVLHTPRGPPCRNRRIYRAKVIPFHSILRYGNAAIGLEAGAMHC